ncbi:MAG: Ig-like domain-containing protein [Cyanobacteria bacterium J06635_1]
MTNATPDQIAAVLLEEIGHGLDARLNHTDSPGDEGAIFSAIVRGVELNEAQWQALKGEDDTTSVVIDGQTFAAEASTITVDTLTDVTNATDGLTSLREALASAVSGDVITFDSSLSGGTITLGGTELDVTTSLTLDGDLNNDGTPDIIIDANNSSRVLDVTDGNNGVDQSVIIDGLIITGGNSTGNGGGISNRETLLVSNSTITGNAAGDASIEGGAGIYNNGATLTLENSTISSNTAFGYGGGIRNRNSAVLIVNNSIISDNTSSNTTNTFYRGGGIHTRDSTTFINNSTISGNAARLGGGIQSTDNELTITNSTISGNSSTSSGGGIYGRDTGFLKVSNSTISGNSSGSDGGGIKTISAAHSSTITNSTIANNTSVGGGDGISATNSSTVTLANTIIANGTSETDVRGNTPTFLGVNIIEDGSKTGTNVLNVDPLLGDLQDNGGPTFTHALLAGSPALNAADNTQLPTETDLGIDVDGDGTIESTVISVDQRGFAREFGTLDIGAFELQNDVPMISLPTAPSVEEDSSSNTISGIAIADGDSDDQSVTIGVTNGTISLNGTTGLSFTFGDGTDDSTLIFSGALADVNTALNDLTFTPTADFNGTATIQLQTTDIEGYSDTETLSITVNDAPEVSSLVIGDTSPTNASSVTFDVTFSESVTGVGTADFALATTGTASGTIASVSGSGTSYTVTVNSLSGEGTLGLNLVDDDSIVNGNSVALGGAGTSGTGDGSFTGGTYTIDTTVPAAPSTPDLAATSDTGSANTDNITASTTPALTGTAEANSTVTVTSDVDGVIGSAIANGSGNWAIVASTLAAGGHSITATATDSFGNVSTASGALSITVDTAAPTVAISSTAPTSTNASPIPVTITFSEAVTDFVIGDVTVGNGTASNFATSDNQTFTLDVTPTGDGTVTVDVAANVAQDTAGNQNTAATQFSISSDRTAPTLTSFVRQTPTDSTTNADSLVFLTTFSEDVQNVDTADFTVNGSTTATVTNVSQTSASTYEVTLSGGDLASFNGTVGLNLAGGQNITDDPGNALPAGEPTTDETYTVDNTSPTVSLTSAAADPINSTFGVTATFSEATADFTDTDILVTNGSVSNFSGSGTTYTFDVTPAADGAVDVDIAASVATDAAGNANTAATTLSRTFDATAPTVSLTSTAANPINSAFSVTATFNEITTDFTATDISVTNGSVSNFSGAGTTYTFDVTPAADGTVDVDIAGGVATDAAGNNNTAATTLSRTFDATAPTVSLTSAAADPVNSTFSVTATFSEATSDFTDADISVTNGSVSNFSGSGTTYTFDITPTADGSVDVDIAGGVATDAAGNSNTTATTLSRTFDATAPTVSLTSPAADPINSTFSVTATFNEATTDFTATDISVTNGSVSNFSGSGTTYTFDVTPTADGAVDIDIAAGVATDAAGNSNTAATTLSRTFDATAPTVSLTSAAVNPINSTFSVTATFNEITTDFTDADISVTNGSVSNFSGSGTTYTFDVTPAADGTVDVNVAGGVATDAAGNSNTAATTLSRTFDAITPTVTLTSAATNPINSTFSVTTTFSEATSDFTDADISVTNGSVSNFSGSGTTYTFDVTPTADGAVDVDIAGGVATDAAGNSNTAATTLSRTFDATAPTVTNVTPNLTSIVDSNVGTGTFTLTVDFSEAMDTSVTPTLSFPTEDPTSTLTPNSGSWSDSDTYIATYDVADANETVSDIDVQVSGAQDTAGNLLTPLAQTDEFSISTASTIEFAAASFTADETILTSNAVTLIRTGDTSDTASVQVNITGGTAAAADYTSSGFPLTVTFDPTETSKTVAIPIIDDLLVEGDETILLSISSASNATIGSQSTATLTITDNDTAGFILDKTNVTVSEAGTIETFNITLGSEPGSDVVLNITGSDPSEATVAPTSVTLNSTNWDTGVDVTITGEDDTEVDGDQTSTLTISVDADNSDDAFDGLSDQTLSVSTIDDDTLALLTPVPAVSVLEVTSLGTADTVRLEVEAVGVDSVSEILIFSTDVSGASRTQIGRFSLLEGGKLPAAYVPEFTVNNSAIEQGDYLQFELIEKGQTRMATLTSIDDDQVALDFGDGTQLTVSLFDQTSTTNLLVNDASAIDLTGLDGQMVNVEFAVYREAKFDNTLRFYRTDFADGSIVTDPLTGTVLRPGEVGYEQAAIARQLDIEITGQNNQVNTFATTIDGGDYLGMFLIVDGNDPATNEVYFSHAGVNENQTDRAKLLGDNTFGFEDLPNLGDRDFDDIVVEFAIS